MNTAQIQHCAPILQFYSAAKAECNKRGEGIIGQTYSPKVARRYSTLRVETISGDLAGKSDYSTPQHSNLWRSATVTHYRRIVKSIDPVSIGLLKTSFYPETNDLGPASPKERACDPQFMWDNPNWQFCSLKSECRRRAGKRSITLSNCS
jgi:hypothetical protein